MTRTIGELLAALEAIAPLRLAEAWDNVGLLVGSRDWPVKRGLLTIDLTPAVMDEAIRAKANLIVAYHPPIFEPLKRVTGDDWKQSIVLEAAANRIAIYSPHTAMDAAPGGVNDWLIGAFGEGDRRALQPSGELPAGESFKLVTFCPENATDRIRDALANAGAGRIGAYCSCSFELRGTGTFFGGESTKPSVGKRGTLERVDEVRLELVCPGEPNLAGIIAALLRVHPYEEPAFEVYPLHARPLSDSGMGRFAELRSPATLNELVARIKKHLKLKSVEVAAGDQAPKRCRFAAACAGAGGSLLADVLAAGCQVYLTGEMRHHDVLDAQHRGCTIILAGHSNTERGFLPILRRRLLKEWGKVDVVISKRDRHPLIGR